MERLNEIWKWIDGFEGQYQVSNVGRIRSHKKWGWKIMRLILNKHRHKTGQQFYVNLRRDNKIIKRRVHRLVAIAFLGQGDLGSNYDVIHKDLNPFNNNADNLQWTSRKSRHDREYLGLPQKSYIKLKEQRDIENIITAFESGIPTTQIAANLKMNTAHILSVIHGRVWKEKQRLAREILI